MTIKRFGAAGVKIGEQIAQRLRVAVGGRVDRCDEVDWRAERVIYPMAQRLHVGGLARSSQHQGSAAAGPEIGGHGLGKLTGVRRELAGRHWRAERARDFERNVADEFRAATRRDDRPKRRKGSRPVRRHRGARNSAATCDPRAPTMSRPKRIWSGPQPERIGVEQQRHARIGKTRQRIHRAAESQDRAITNRIVLNRLVAIPFGLRKSFRQRADLR